MKTFIKCGCGRVTRWKDMPGGKRQRYDDEVLEFRHCACGSTHTQIVPDRPSQRISAKDILKR